MKTLMYPIAPDDDFPEMFYAIRPNDGEHQFYVPEHGSAGACLWELYETLMDRNQSVETLTRNNAKLRELAAQMEEMLDCVICDRRVECNWRDDGPCWYEIELRKLGVEP